MGWKNQREINRTNQQLSNVCTARGHLENIGGYLCPDGTPRNFIISGGALPDEKYRPLGQVLSAQIGSYPVIVLHGNDDYMEAVAMQAWRNEVSDPDESPLWVINQQYSTFEPFFGMNEMQVVMALRQLARKLDYTVTPRFERVIRTHLTILKELNSPISLSGLYYLCQFYDLGEFHDNIMALPCGELKARRIWADLGTDADEGNNQFDLFRAVINNLAHNASQSGWNDDGEVSEYNCLQAIRQKATLIMSVNDRYAELLLPYIVEELKAADRPFVLILDGLQLTGEHFVEYLCLPNSGCYCGVVAENIVEMFGGDENTFLRLAEKMSCFVFYKHGTGKTAAVLSEVLGKYDYTKVEVSQGVNRGVFSFMPRDRHDDVRYSVENRFRVMPEEITSLREGQAIIFDTVTDQIIHYN